MSQCMVPNWNLRHQRQEQVERAERNRSSHVNNNTATQQHNNLTATSTSSNHHLFPMTNYEVAELTWQNGQLAMHGLGGLLPTTPTKPTWGRSGDTLESIVHQATSHKEVLNSLQQDHKTQVKLSSKVPSSGGKWSGSSGQVQMVPSRMPKKRLRADSGQCGGNIGGGSTQEERVDRSACASASATFCKDNDTTMMTWASYESPRNFKAKTTDEDSASHGGSENQLDEEQEIKGAETGRSHSSRRSRAAAIHNQSERRRRDRINQKMKALQRLVPNASKTDKASMLDEVIEYLKQLQAQVQMMHNMRNVNMPPQMMMPLGMQQHLQMSLLARMASMGAVGLGMGMGGMLDINSMAAASRGAPHSLPSLIHHPSPVSTATPPFVTSPFLMPSIIPPQPNPESTDTNASVPLPDPYCTAFLAQSMNIDLYNKMAALYRQQDNQSSQLPTSGPSQRSNHVKRD